MGYHSNYSNLKPSPAWPPLQDDITGGLLIGWQWSCTMYMTVDGYRMVSCGSRKKQKLEHRVVWEKAYGPIPKGCQIHHKNEDRADNRIENLECLTVLEHKRLHAGWLRDDNGVFYAKKCKCCGAVKPLSEYYTNYRHEHFLDCKECCRERTKRVHAEKKARKEKQLCLSAVAS